MQLITRTSQKVVFEATHTEFQERGFDSIWDEIRADFPEDAYELHTVEQRDKVFIELKPIVAG